MENIIVRNFRLSDDLDLLDRVINGLTTIEDSIFDEVSMIYRTTNETISNPNYIEKMRARKKVLAVTGSGDQIINSVLQGGEEIIGLDICRFPKYFVTLKLAAIKALNKEEYIEYIIGDVDRYIYPLSKKYYDRVRQELSDDAREFWDHVFENRDEREVYNSHLFRPFQVSPKRFIRNNPYLQGDNYNKVKQRLSDVSICLGDGDFFNTDLSEFDKVDLVLLSNIFNYISVPAKSVTERVKMYKDFLKKLPLKINGIALTYNFVYDGTVEDLFLEDDFTVYKIDEGIVSAPVENELIEFKKKKKSKLLEIFSKKQ